VLTAARADAQWLPTTGGTSDTILCFATSGNTVLSGTVNGVYRSTDDGATWTQSNTGLTDLTVYALNASGSSIFAGTRNGIFRSTDAGLNWLKLVTTGLLAVQHRAVVALGTSLYVGTWGSGVFRSTDDGSSWTQVNTGLSQTNIMALAVVNATLYAAAWGGSGVYWSSDSGLTWNGASGLGFNKETEAIGGTTSLMIAVTNSGIYRSTNQGMDWAYANSPDSGMTSIVVTGSAVFVGSNWGVRRSTDGGITWTRENAGLTALAVRALGANSTHVFAGVLGSGIWRRPTAGFATSVERASGSIPDVFRLEQNYPNPFNPTTNFEFRVGSFALVKLSIVNILGNEVTVLVNEYVSPGRYKISWDPAGLPSGTYFGRLTAAGFVETRRLVLLR